MSLSRQAIRVIIADDEPDIVTYLSALMHLEGFEVAGTASDAPGAVRLAETEHPEVALLDLSMPGGGLGAALRIRSVSPDTHVVIFSAAAADLEILPLLSAGIDGYVVKDGSPDQLINAIRTALRGGAYLAPDATKVAVDELASRLHAEERTTLGHAQRRELINQVISAKQFRSVHQPIVDVRTNAPCGVEALTRFTGDPPRPPDAWFDEAEQVGERTSLELATAREALRGLNQLRSRLYMTVNISPATALSGRLAEVLVGIDLKRVVLEVTEHAPVTDYAALVAALAPWRERGARLAVDDAGGGYASFSHILNLAPEFIKLDISLVREIDVDPKRQALARAICGFAEELGVLVIAEGVATAAELRAVTALGTPLVQGFHLGHALPLATSQSCSPGPGSPEAADETTSCSSMSSIARARPLADVPLLAVPLRVYARPWGLWDHSTWYVRAGSGKETGATRLHWFRSTDHRDPRG